VFRKVCRTWRAVIKQVPVGIIFKNSGIDAICASFSNVRHIYINEEFLFRTPALEIFSNITSLQCDYAFQSIPLSCLPNPEMVKSIYIKHADRFDIGILKNLEALQCSMPLFDAGLLTLTNLKTLVITDTTLELASLNSLNQLQYLRFSNQSLKLHKKLLLPKLQTLDLNRCHIEGKTLIEIFDNLSDQLISLRMTNMKIKELYNIPHLKVLKYFSIDLYTEPYVLLLESISRSPLIEINFNHLPLKKPRILELFHNIKILVLTSSLRMRQQSEFPEV
jgi:hypothetical protein